jgi:uncharacterized membrane protein YdbT with pleckstrin-like domain
MNEIITEKNYPVQKLWLVFRSIITFLFILVFLVPPLFFAYKRGEISKDGAIFYIILVIGATIFHFIVKVLERANFHYSIEEKFLTVKQGILSKRQRHIPYGVIQNLFVKQDLFDRILGFASLMIENASQGGGALEDSQQTSETIGFSGNRVSIPGLTKADAEILKGIILQKMKENPIEDSQSGL